ncbi:NapC/NirT family cytochrome c [Neiella sp. HB171785]|uniref:Cytochrome c-type protein n=1 Tax=Neiella litorisoli TaxID=2771431 RepID=A0A8J6R3F0_9GAMM|nr:NapC/NirT family cytochrome c [Neiella litorisoli]MBD1390265.1 NapC/NirT family cytochrome c [Neiella litorisoli]
MDALKRWLKGLFRPSAKWSIAALVALGVSIGVVGVVTFEVGMAYTNTEEFCTGCHLQPGATAETYHLSSHYNNRTGVRPICSDCHVPHEFGPKMWRKIIAAKEVWSHLMGNLETTEKYLQRVVHMREREINRLKANDSQECRNCHEVERWILALQTEKAQQFHQSMKNNNKTCIDCHQGMVHMSDMVAEVVNAAEQ